MSFEQEESAHSFLKYRPYPSIYSQMLQVLDVILAVLPLTHEGYHLGKFLPSGKNVYLYRGEKFFNDSYAKGSFDSSQVPFAKLFIKKAWIISNFYLFSKSIH